MVTCEQCGTESPDDFRFCPACAAPLVRAEVRRQTRKVVTVLFCDVTGSTSLGEQLDPEVLRGVMNRYFADMRATIERHGGTVEKFIGDAVMAVFGIPHVHEDDALRAVRAAAEIRERLPEIAAEVGVTLRFRTGVNTGAVLSGEGENLAIGDAVNVAARLEQAAAPGEIVLGAETLQLVRDAVLVQPLEPLELKGKSEPVQAYRLEGVDPLAPGVARHLDAPLVGRERELRTLTEAWGRALEGRSCHLLTMLGMAGVGKSRLVTELLASVGDDVTVLRGRCLHYGEGITFWPLVDALMSAGEQAKAVLERLETGGAAIPEELFWEVRRLLETIAEERPLILHIDDLQWAEPMLLDLLDHVTDFSRGTPILLLCTARPELLDDRSGWGGGKVNTTTVLLEPLGTDECERLLDQLGDGLDAEDRARVVRASEGNPLFLEEMVALAGERGTVAVPSTIQALLAARLERLAVEERELLERGAVEGEVFHRLAVRALTDERLAPEVERRLAALVRRELIRPHPATLQGDEAFRFRHLLIRDAAYDGLPKAVRAELHERFAHWLEQVGSDLAEFDEIAGWHQEQSLRYREELGQDPDPALARRAAEHLLAAARRAIARIDGIATRNFLERVMELTQPGDELHARASADLAEVAIEDVELERADELITIAERHPATANLAALSRFEWRLRAQPARATSELKAQLPQIFEELERMGDHRGLAKAHYAAALMHWLASNATPTAEHARFAAQQAELAGDMGLRSRAMGWYCAALLLGETSVATVADELDAIEREDPGPFLMALITSARAQLAIFAGQSAPARALNAEAFERVRALHGLGSQMLESTCHSIQADIELLDGRPEIALEVLRANDRRLAESDEHSYRSTVQANIAKVEERLGNLEEARAAVELSLELGASEDVINYAITYPVRARLALAAGDHQAAERSAQCGVEYAFMTDFVVEQATALISQSDILQAVGRHDEATEKARAALELYEPKGDVPGAERARALLAELGQ